MAKTSLLFILFLSACPNEPSPPPPPTEPTEAEIIRSQLTQDELAKIDALSANRVVSKNASSVALWPGLPNIGSTCFINAVLKLLAADVGWDGFLLDNTADTETIREIRTKLRAIVNLIRLGDRSPGATILRPNLDLPNKYIATHLALVQFIEAFAKDPLLEPFSKRCDADAQEFMIKLADVLKITEKDLLAIQITDILTPINKDTSGETRGQTRISKQEKSIIWSLTATEKITIKQATDDYSIEERVPDVIDPLDKQKKEHFKQILPTKIPEFMLVGVKREFFDFDKLQPAFTNKPLIFEEALKLNSFIQGTDGKWQRSTITANMSAQATIVRRGTTGGAHYVAYVKDNKTSKWYLMNDSQAPQEATPGDEGPDSKGNLTGRITTILYQRI